MVPYTIREMCADSEIKGHGHSDIVIWPLLVNPIKNKLRYMVTYYVRKQSDNSTVKGQGHCDKQETDQKFNSV
jgi:hypothetical protein